MGKIKLDSFRYLNDVEFKMLKAVEMGMKNHELVEVRLVASLANIRHSVHNTLYKLCRNKLLCYERGKNYDGYRLTNLGYDYLAIKNLVNLKVIDGFGTQIGTGKESSVFIVKDADDRALCLKLHRLGRVCFRKLKEKRDYHKNRKHTSWLYLSKLSAEKEFVFMNALYENDFPIPRPLGWNRHCIVMELISGYTLNNITEVGDVPALYDDLMNLLVKLGNYGLIHGDFNEFNIMVKEDGKPVMIDFPQMVSTSHRNAEMYFERDVHGVRDFFRRRFNYESEDFPTFDDIEREEESEKALDILVKASGYSVDYLRDLMAQDIVKDENDSSEEDLDSEDSELHEVDEEEDAGNHSENIDNVDRAEEQNMDSNTGVPEENKEQDNLQEEPVELNINSTEEGKKNKQHVTINEDSDVHIDSKISKRKQKDLMRLSAMRELVKELHEDIIETPVSDDETETTRDVSPTRSSMSIRSNFSRRTRLSRIGSSVASTIPSEIVEERVEKEVKRKMHAERPRPKVKGEASAVIRRRRDNDDTIKNSHGLWGWAE